MIRKKGVKNGTEKEGVEELKRNVKKRVKRNEPSKLINLRADTGFNSYATGNAGIEDESRHGPSDACTLTF